MTAFQNNETGIKKTVSGDFSLCNNRKKFATERPIGGKTKYKTSFKRMLKIFIGGINLRFNSDNRKLKNRQNKKIGKTKRLYDKGENYELFNIKDFRLLITVR